MADGSQDVKATQATLEGLKANKNGSIMDVFQSISKGKVVYSTRQHTKIQAQYA